MDEVKHIVFAADDHYAQHAAVAIASILLHTPKAESVDFYVLSDGISEEKKEKLYNTTENLCSTLKIIETKGSFENDYFVNGFLSRAAYLRLEAADLLPKTVSQALYLDCDLVVLDDILKLFAIGLDGKPIAAIPDLGIMASQRSMRQKREWLGLELYDQYFNSGVLLLDLDLWRRFDYAGELRHLASEHRFPHHDQDAMNKVFYRQWNVLPLRWNVIPPVWSMFLKVVVNSRYRSEAVKARENMALLHYAGGYKPWEYERYERFNGTYYDCLAKTAFRDVQMPQYDQRKTHRSIRRQMFRLRLGDFWAGIFQKR